MEFLEEETLTPEVNVTKLYVLFDPYTEEYLSIKLSSIPTCEVQLPRVGTYNINYLEQATLSPSASDLLSLKEIAMALINDQNKTTINVDYHRLLRSVVRDVEKVYLVK